jgi:hypothetical protein
VQWSELSMFEWISGILTPNLSFGIPKDDTHLFQIHAVVLCDMMWFSRNQAIHKGVLLKVSSFAATIKRLSLDHFAAWQSKSQPTAESWSPPAAGSFKVNFDTAIRDLFSVQAAVCRDEKGSIISSCFQYIPPCEPSVGEAQAALLAAFLASSLKLVNFVSEGNSTIVINSLKDPSTILDWKLDNYISLALSLIPPSPLWEGRKVNKNANFWAHYVAYWVAARVISGCIPTFFSLFSPPLSIPICSAKIHPPFSPP